MTWEAIFYGRALSIRVALWLAFVTGWMFVSPFALATDYQPDSLRILALQQAYIALHKGDITQARLFFETVVELFPESPEAAEGLFRLAHLDIREHFFDDAQRRFEQVVNHHAARPDFIARAKLQLGFVDIMKFFTRQWWV